MHGVRDVFGHAQGAALRKKKVHFGRGFRAGGQLEFDFQTVYDHYLAGVGDVVGRLDQRRNIGRSRLPQTSTHLPRRVFGQQVAIHVAGAAAHHVTGDDIFADGVLHEMLRSDNLCLAGFNVGRINDPLDAAPVIDVAVGIDDGDNRFAAQVLIDQPQARLDRARGHQRVDNDIAAVGFDDAHH